MPVPPNGGPTDSLLRIFAAVREHLRDVGGTDWVPEAIDVHVRGHVRPITFLVPPAIAPASVWVPSDVQACVLEALAGKSLRTKELARAAGVSERDLFRHPGGLRELQDRGDVVNHKRLGYFRPDDPPEGVDLQ